jgi:lipid II:glycine glycyltransferase (peptidoglycan interpeptide bridge formation enzyme)
MEDVKNTKVKTITISDIRQSENWAKYLEWLGWRSFRTSGGVNVEVMKTPVGGLIKIQRPKHLNKKDLDEVEKIRRENKAMFVKIEPLLGQNLSVFEKNDYTLSVSPLAPPSTIYIDLTLEEKVLWKNISKSGRYSIRSADKEGVKVHFYPHPKEEVLEQFYSIAKETSRKQGFVIQSLADLKKKAEIFGKEAFVVLSFNKEKQLLGGKFFLGHEKSVWYLHAGTNELGRRSDAGHKMMWESFLYFKKAGYKVMDMDGIDDERFPSFTKNWGGFSYFKEKFGGEIIRFPEPRIKYFSRFLRFLAKRRAMPL